MNVMATAKIMAVNDRYFDPDLTDPWELAIAAKPNRRPGGKPRQPACHLRTDTKEMCRPARIAIPFSWRSKESVTLAQGHKLSWHSAAQCTGGVGPGVRTAPSCTFVAGRF